MSYAKGIGGTGWIHELMAATSELESPRRFFFWSALCALSAVARKNVYLRRQGVYKLYPNIFVLLVAKSGLRKSVPPNLARKLVKQVGNTRLIAGRSSIEGILSELSKATSAPGKRIDKESTAFIVSGEFSQSILRNEDALTILTNLYDTEVNDEFKNLLKGGQEELKDVCVTMLGASAPVHLEKMLTKREVSGGFIGRTFMIYENERANINPLTDDENEELADTINIQRLADHLVALSTVNGRFKYSIAGRKLYDDWYNNYKPPDDDITGTSDRIGDHILKVAMLLSLSRGFSLVLEEEDIDDAIQICFDCFTATRRITMGSGDHASAGQTKLLLGALLAAEGNELRRTKILNRFWGDIDSIDLDRITGTLLEGNYITVRSIGSERVYRLKPEVVRQYNDYKNSQEAGT